MKAEAKKHVLKFDPRTELLLLVLANVVAFTQHSLWIEITWVVLLLLLITACGCRKAAVKLAVAFGFCLLLQYYIFPNGPQIIGSTFFIIVSYTRKIFPCLIVGAFIVKKTSVRELMLALRKWHIPQGLIIPLSVTIRYFPAIREEISYIRDAMKLRNIHGLQKIECLLVPVMISATATAEELSAAAVTRGIENPKPKTSIITMRFGLQDVLCLTAGVIFCMIAIALE
jgi:energy-coupling factor transport system permease protein